MFATMAVFEGDRRPYEALAGQVPRGIAGVHPEFSKHGDKRRETNIINYTRCSKIKKHKLDRFWSHAW
jgi:hypothetical protein